jgi:copper resistance protein D
LRRARAQIKVLIFLAMVIVAIVNRFALTPRLLKPNVVAALRRNALIETAFGLLILCIVARLGTMPPALLDHAGMQH